VVVSAAVGVIAAPVLILGGWLFLIVAAYLVVPAWYGRFRLHALSGMLAGSADAIAEPERARDHRRHRAGGPLRQRQARR